MAIRYADASLENTLRAREAVLPKLHPGDDGSSGALFIPARLLDMKKTFEELSPYNRTITHDSNAAVQIARHLKFE